MVGAMVVGAMVAGDMDWGWPWQQVVVPAMVTAADTPSPGEANRTVFAFFRGSLGSSKLRYNALSASPTPCRTHSSALPIYTHVSIYLPMHTPMHSSSLRYAHVRTSVFACIYALQQLAVHNGTHVPWAEHVYCLALGHTWSAGPGKAA